MYGEWVATKWRRRRIDGDLSDDNVSIHLEPCCDVRGGRFVVRDGFGNCLNTAGQWEYEPSNSNRDSAFFERCRFPNFFNAALALYASEGVRITSVIWTEIKEIKENNE